MSGCLFTATQRRRVERELVLAREAAFFRRVFALLELDAGRPLGEVARQLRVAPRSLYRWVERYRIYAGLEGLRHQSGQGRPLRWDETLADLLPAVLARCPRDFGYFSTGWTVSLLPQGLAQGRPEPARSEDTIRRRLHERGYVWKRFRYVLNPDPEQEKKTPTPPPNPGFGRAHGALGPGRNRVVAPAAPACGLDAPGPTGARPHPRPKRAAPRVRQPAPADRPRAVAGSAASASRKLSGVSYPDSRALPRLAGGPAAGCQFLPHRPGFAGLGPSLGHSALVAAPRSPHLNPLEHLWRHGKAVVCANPQDPTLEEQVDHFIHYRQSLSPNQRLRKAGVFSGKSWLQKL